MFEQAEEMSGAVSPLGSTGLLEVVLGLAFVIVLIFALAWLYKRVGAGALGMGGLIKIQAAVSLGNRDRIALITVADKHLLVGISPGRINTLHVFDETLELDAAATATDGQGAAIGGADFASKLQKALIGLKS